MPEAAAWTDGGEGGESEFAKDVDTVANRAQSTLPAEENGDPDTPAPETTPSPGAYRMRRPAAVDDVYTPSPDLPTRERATPLRVRLGPPRKA
jgi:hypothetical protein